MEFIHTCTVKHGKCCSKSQWFPPKPVSLLLTCLNRHMSKHTISAPVMPKMAWNRSALHDVLAQGASRDIMVIEVGCNNLITNSMTYIDQNITWSIVQASCVINSRILLSARSRAMKWKCIHCFNTGYTKPPNNGQCQVPHPYTDLAH